MSKWRCEQLNRRRAARAVMAGVVVLCLGAAAQAGGTLRLWPTAVVNEDVVRVRDLCVLAGFDAAAEATVAEVVVGDAPAPGGSRVMHADLIRAALADAGVNMAQVTLRGAVQCGVARPGVVSQPGASDALATADAPPGSGTPDESNRTLQQAVVEFLNAELARYHGTADVVFDRRDEQVLALCEPAYSFVVRRERGGPLGLTTLSVAVLADGRAVQNVQLVVRVTMMRDVVVARRGISQGALIRPQDVHRVSLSFTSLDRLGMDEPAAVIGQKAKKYLPAGSMLEPDAIESLPLVTRGQLITLASVSGGVSVVTSAKAADTGYLGDVITVQAVDNARQQFEGVVVGPGRVQLGGRTTAREESGPMYAQGGTH